MHAWARLLSNPPHLSSDLCRVRENELALACRRSILAFYDYNRSPHLLKPVSMFVSNQVRNRFSIS